MVKSGSRISVEGLGLFGCHVVRAAHRDTKKGKVVIRHIPEPLRREGYEKKQNGRYNKKDLCLFVAE